jgi:hypothetical protein
MLGHHLPQLGDLDGGPASEITAASLAQRGENREPRQPGSPVRVGRPVQLKGLPSGEIVERLQGGGEKLPRR